MNYCPNTNTNLRLTANELKTMIASFLLSRDNNGTIGYEVMYGSSRCVADMVFISKGHSFAIEIKSEFDTTTRLEKQLQEYQSLFDYILIFTAPNHMEAITTILPEYVGLYCISKAGIQKKQREKLNHHVLKSEMLISIPSAAIKHKFSIKGKLTSDEIRSVVMKKSYKSIHNYFISYYIEKLSVRKSIKSTKVPITSIEPEDDYIII